VFPWGIFSLGAGRQVGEEEEGVGAAVVAAGEVAVLGLGPREGAWKWARCLWGGPVGVF